MRNVKLAVFAVNNGDTILVAPGVYVDNINFQGKAITLQSEQGPDVTIIDGHKLDSVVRIVAEILDNVISNNVLSSASEGGISLLTGSAPNWALNSSSVMMPLAIINFAKESVSVLTISMTTATN